MHLRQFYLPEIVLLLLEIAAERNTQTGNSFIFNYFNV